MSLGDFYTGLYVSGIGILVVFTVLSILVIILSMFKTILYKPKRIEITRRIKEAKTEKGEGEVSTKEKISDKENTLPIMVSAAIIAFNEYKYSKLKKYELFREFPALIRLLSLAGIHFKGRVKISIGGKEVYADVEELPNGVYNVRISGKTYSVKYSV
jgi:Na+-transporting methylmalonyl-CoA/oxaloacetate decarboxylase gamma subunit